MIRKLTLVLALISGLASAQEDIAQNEANHWLQLVDSQQYQTSWEQSAEFFRKQVPLQSWVKAAKETREPLGVIESREVMHSEAIESLPNVPKGEYVVIQYRSDFVVENEAIETVTLVKDGNDWNVVGYYVTY
ncbi:DUF4019 domain-containing protein [Vibrio sp. RE88]|uniref:DUF4019 domain-containing protein n=1 Tax=Vibrio sp. RE88 TaxID=2607610 RepID=UPI001493BC67|nr:DUF4019 domain-containing protein [Vibrio sp. RE88]NOH62690.1 DUF4019 domain-containing protein [Vibrio sp. RE88]